MSDREDAALRRLVAELEVDHQRQMEKDASGWLVLSRSELDGSPIHCLGPYESPEAALMVQQACYEQDRRDGDEDPAEPSVTHHIVPLFPPEHGPQP